MFFSSFALLQITFTIDSHKLVRYNFNPYLLKSAISQYYKNVDWFRIRGFFYCVYLYYGVIAALWDKTEQLPCNNNSVRRHQVWVMTDSKEKIKRQETRAFYTQWRHQHIIVIAEICSLTLHVAIDFSHQINFVFCLPISTQKWTKKWVFCDVE